MALAAISALVIGFFDLNAPAAPALGADHPKEMPLPRKAAPGALYARGKAREARQERPQDPVRTLKGDQGRRVDPLDPIQRPRQAAPRPLEDADVGITAGVRVFCCYQFSPGVEGAKLPAKKAYESGATIRLLDMQGKKVVQVGKTTKSGWLRLAAPPGKYLLEIVPAEAGEGVQSPVEVTIRKDSLTRVEITITRDGF